MASFGARLYGTGATAVRFALEITAFGTVTYVVSEFASELVALVAQVAFDLKLYILRGIFQIETFF